MRCKVIFLLCLILNGNLAFSQNKTQDSIFLMNGLVVAQNVLDTVLGAITINDPKKPQKKIHYELEQLYMVKFSDGFKRYYYVQDTTLNNWFTRDEMWMYMKGEADAHKGFKARGSMIGAGIAGLLGGMTGTFFAPVAPYGFMAFSGIPKVKIKAETISNPAYVESDAYILGYERVARQKRKIRAIFGGTAGLILGYSIYALCHQYYPEKIDVGFSK